MGNKISWIGLSIGEIFLLGVSIGLFKYFHWFSFLVMLASIINIMYFLDFRSRNIDRKID